MESITNARNDNEEGLHEDFFMHSALSVASSALPGCSALCASRHWHVTPYPPSTGLAQRKCKHSETCKVSDALRRPGGIRLAANLADRLASVTLAAFAASLALLHPLRTPGVPSQPRRCHLRMHLTHLAFSTVKPPRSLSIRCMESITNARNDNEEGLHEDFFMHGALSVASSALPGCSALCASRHWHVTPHPPSTGLAQRKCKHSETCKVSDALRRPGGIRLAANLADRLASVTLAAFAASLALLHPLRTPGVPSQPRRCHRACSSHILYAAPYGSVRHPRAAY